MLLAAKLAPQPELALGSVWTPRSTKKKTCQKADELPPSHQPSMPGKEMGATRSPNKESPMMQSTSATFILDQSKPRSTTITSFVDAQQDEVEGYATVELTFSDEHTQGRDTNNATGLRIKLTKQECCMQQITIKICC